MGLQVALRRSHRFPLAKEADPHPRVPGATNLPPHVVVNADLLRVGLDGTDRVTFAGENALHAPPPKAMAMSPITTTQGIHVLIAPSGHSSPWRQHTFRDVGASGPVERPRGWDSASYSTRAGTSRICEHARRHGLCSHGLCYSESQHGYQPGPSSSGGSPLTVIFSPVMSSPSTTSNALPLVAVCTWPSASQVLKDWLERLSR